MAPHRAMVGSTFVVCVLAGFVWSVILDRRLSHSIRFDWGYQSEMDELQVPIADCAFYLSYYYDVVRAPSLADGMSRLLRDSRSEAPDVINALHKFNVVPELVVAAAHRLLGARQSPFSFYLRVLLSFTGLGAAALAFAASQLGGSLLCGLSAISLYFGICYSPSMNAGTRFHGVSSFALREHWGIPAMLVQNTCLITALMSQERSYASLLGYAVCTCVFEACWQFAPFVLLLQMLSLLGAHVLVCLSLARVREVSLAAVVGTLGALVLSFGNRMLLCSPFFGLAVSMIGVGLVPIPRVLARRGAFVKPAWVAMAAVGVGSFAQQLLARLASDQAEAHILQLLLQKLGLSPPDISFDAFLYLQSEEFGFISMHYVQEAIAAGVLPSAGLSLLLLVVAALRRRLIPWFRDHRVGDAPDVSSMRLKTSGGKHNKKSQIPAGSQRNDLTSDQEYAICWGSWATETLFVAALVILACLVNRLRVLAAPVLCILGSMVASPLLWAEVVYRGRGSSWLAHGLALPLLAMPFYGTGILERPLKVQDFSADPDMRELVIWANNTLSEDTLLMADMTLSAKLRLISPKIRVGNHPQYESATSRQRNRDYYRTFSCAPPQSVHEVLSHYGVTHVLLNANACRSRMGKLDPFHDEADHCGNAPKQTLQVQGMTFCWGGFLSQGPGLFELAFRNPIYTVLRLSRPGMATSASGSGERPSRSITNIASTAVWRPWLVGLRGRAVARAIARAASDWPKKYGGFEVAELMQKKAEALLPGDAIVSLQRAQLHMSRGDEQAAHKGMLHAAEAAQVAGKPKVLFQVFLRWKKLLSQHGSLSMVKHIAKYLQPFLVATRDAWELCDLSSWIAEMGDQSYAAELWEAAKNASLYDGCVREDWSRWEGRALTTVDTWKLFLGI